MKPSHLAHGPLSVSAAVSAILSLAASGVHAGPQNGVVTAGQATISTPEANLTQIDQSSQNVSINWDSFDVAAQERVNFSQPSSDAVALNRILSQDPSLILGSITANGRVFLLNPNGMIFGQSARVNVGSLVASSLDVADADDGRYAFSSGGAKRGDVVNQGQLTAADGGSISLLGESVRNAGLIVADYGTVNLGAGRAATLHFDGAGLVRFQIDAGVAGDGAGAAVANEGEISAAGGQVLLTSRQVGDVMAQAVNNSGVIRASRIDNSGGRIQLLGLDGETVNSGTLDAAAADAASTGGQVQVLGEQVLLTGTSAVDVSGGTGGGTALIGGSFGGADASIPSARETRVLNGAQIHADSLVSGDAGQVSVWSDGTTRFSGTVSARARGADGDGGFVEISGREHLGIDGHAWLQSQNGRSGTLLLDPGSVTIEHDDAGAGPSAEDDVFTDSWINTQLTTASLSILTSDSDNNATESLTVEADVRIEWTRAESTLTLSGGNSVSLLAGSSIDGAGALVLESDGNVAMDGDVVLGGDLTVTAGGPITQAGSLDIGGVADFRTLNDDGAAITLSGTNDFGIIHAATRNAVDDANVAAAISLREAGGIVLGNVRTAGTLDVVAGGPVTQSSGLTVGGVASFRTLDDNGAAITLGGTNNFGSVSASVRDADNAVNASGSITINEASDTALGTVGTLGALTVNSGGSITQTGVLTVGGDAAFQAAAAGSIALGNAANAFGGSVGLASAGSLQNVTIADATELQLQALTLTGDLNVRGASITQSGALSVAGASSFTANAGQSITLTQDNAFTGAVSLAAAGGGSLQNVSITDLSALSLQLATVSGDLAVVAGGPITQVSALSVGGAARFRTLSASGAAITLDGTNNFGSVHASVRDAADANNAAAAITIRESGSTQLGDVNTGGTLDVVSTGAITQSGALTVGGAASFRTRSDAGAAITLGGTNNFGTIHAAVRNAADSATAAAAITIREAGSTQLGDVSTGGSLDVVSTGAITQSGALTVGGEASFLTHNDAGAAITLGGTNSFGTVHASVRDADNDANASASITINEAGGTALGTIGTLGGLTVTSGGTITQTGVLTIGTNATFQAGAGGSIVLGNASNTFNGTVGLASAGLLQNVTIADSTALQLHALTLAGDLTVRADSITQSGALSVVGASSFIASSGESITLTQGNAFTGAVSLAAAGGGSLQNVSITDSSALALQLPTVSGNLTAVAGGPITQVGALNVGGSASFRTLNDAGAAITLGGTNNFGTVHAAVRNASDSATAAAAITIREAGSMQLGNVSTGGTLDVTSDGAITQSGTLNVGGAASFRTRSNAGAAITLDGSGNSFAGAFNAATRNAGDTANVAAAISLLESDGTLLGNVATAGTLNVVSAGAITQSGSLTVGGEASFRTLDNAGAVITLGGTNNFGSIHASVRDAADATNAAAAITIHEAGSTTLGTVGTAGNLLVTSGGSISQSGALSIGGASAFTAADGGSILLGNTANTLGGAVTLASAGTLQNVTLADTTALDLHAMALAGNLDVRAASITQSGALGIDGTSRFTAAGGQSLQLLDAGNTFTGTVTLAAITGSLLDAGIHSQGGLRLAGSNFSGNLVAASDGDITQTGALAVGGNASFTAGAGHSILLGDATNSFGGPVGFAAAGAGTLQDVTIADTTALDLAALNLTGDLSVTALSISQSGALDVEGAASFTAGAGQSIHLGHTANDFTGTLSFTAAGGGNLADVTLANRSAVDLAALTLNGNLTVASGGAITQSGAWDVAGAARLRTLNDAGAAITLGEANSFGSVHAATRNAPDTANASGAINLHEAGGMALGDIDTAAGAVISSGGGISRVAGTDITAASLSLTAGSDIGSAAAPIVLAGVETILVATTPAQLHLHDSGTLRLSDIQVSGIASITAGGSILAQTPASTINADALVLHAGGSIGEAPGSGAGPLQLQVQSVAATADGGGIHLDASNGDLMLRQISATGPVWLRAASGSLVDDADDPAVATISSAAGGIHLGARDNIGTVTDVASRQGAALLVDTGGGELTAQVTSATGQVNLLFAAGDAPTLGVGAISAGGAGSLLLHSPGDLSLGGLAGAITGFSQAGLSADAVLGLAPGLIGGVSDVLLLHGGADITSAGRVVDVNAGHLVFTSGGQGGDFTLNTAVDRLDASMGGGASLTVDNSTALTVGAISAGGDLSISAADIRDDGDAGSVTRLAAGGTLSLTSQTGIGRADEAAGGRIDTQGTLVLQANAGSVFIANQGDLQIRGQATGGSVDIAAPSGSITVTGALQATGAVNLVAGSDGAAGNILLNGTAQAGQSASLTALGGGAISDAGPGVHLIAGDARLVAGNIGSAGNALDASVSSLEATGTTAVHVNLSGDAQLREIVAPTVVISATGSLIDDGNALTRVSGGNIHLSGASIGAPGGAVGTAADTLSMVATAGSIHINELDAVTLAEVNAAGAGNDITLIAGGAISDDGVTQTRVAGGHLTVTGTSIGAADQALQTQVGALTATTPGALFISEVDGLQLNAVTADRIQIHADGVLTDDGNSSTRLAATTVELAGQSVGTAAGRIGTAADTLMITAGSAGAFVDELDAVVLSGVTVAGNGTFSMHANGAISDAESTAVQAGQVILTGTSIGAADNALDMLTGALTAAATSGDLVLHNTGALRVDGLTAPGAIDVRATGALLQAGAINTAGGAIGLHAASIESSAGATTGSGGGDITYVAEAGDATLGVLDAGTGRALVLARDGVYSVLDPASGLYNLTGSLIEVRAGGLGGAGQIGTAVNPMGIDATDLGPRSVYLVVPAENGVQTTTPQVNLAGASGALLVKGYVGTTGDLLFDSATAFTPEAVVLGAESIVVLLNGRAAVNTDSLSAASQALSSGVVARTNVDWSAFDPDVSLFSTVGPSVRLPDDQVEEAFGE